MRINVYHEELTPESEVVWVEPRPGVRFCGLRIFLKSAPSLHHRPDDDDRSAVTFWFGTLSEASLALEGLIHTVNNGARARFETAKQAETKP